MTGVEPTESGLKANSALDRFKKTNHSIQKANTGQALASAVERHKVEKLWEKDLLSIINLANKLHEVGIMLCVHRYITKKIRGLGPELRLQFDQKYLVNPQQHGPQC